NRSADPVVSCFFGRIAPSDAATESCFSIRGNRENEFASFQGLRHGNLAISIQQSRQKMTLAQWVRTSSRPTTSRRCLVARWPRVPAGAGHMRNVVSAETGLQFLRLKSPAATGSTLPNDHDQRTGFRDRPCLERHLQLPGIASLDNENIGLPLVECQVCHVAV